MQSEAQPPSLSLLLRDTVLRESTTDFPIWTPGEAGATARVWARVAHESSSLSWRGDILMSTPRIWVSD